MKVSIFYITPKNAQWKEWSTRLTWLGLMCCNHYQKRSIWDTECPPALILTLMSKWKLGPGARQSLCCAWSLGNECKALILCRKAADLLLNGHNLWPLPLRTRTTPVTHRICPLHSTGNLLDRIFSVKSELSQGVQIQDRITKTLIPTAWKHKTCNWL